MHLPAAAGAAGSGAAAEPPPARSLTEAAPDSALGRRQPSPRRAGGEGREPGTDSAGAQEAAARSALGGSSSFSGRSALGGSSSFSGRGPRALKLRRRMRCRGRGVNCSETAEGPGNVVLSCSQT